MVGLEQKIFKTKVLRWLENAILTLVFANTVNISYTCFQQLHKQYIALTLQELLTSNDAMTQFYLNFLTFSNLCVLHSAHPRFLRPWLHKVAIYNPFKLFTCEC